MNLESSYYIVESTLMLEAYQLDKVGTAHFHDACLKALNVLKKEGSRHAAIKVGIDYLRKNQNESESS